MDQIIGDGALDLGGHGLRTAPPDPFAIHSGDVRLIIPALANAQGKMIPPRKNKTVSFRTKKGQLVTYSYATLDAVIDAIRDPLAEHGIYRGHFLATTPKGERMVVTRLWLADQFLATWYPIILDADMSAQQAFASAITFGKRYNLCELCDLAGEEDDDGHGAAGNSYQILKTGASGYDQVMRAAKASGDDHNGGLILLRAWQQNMGDVSAMREDESKSKEWDMFLNTVGGCLERSFGRSFAWTWSNMLRARTAAARDAMNEEYRRDHASAIAELRKTCSQAVAYLLDHLKFFSEVIEIDERRAALARTDAEEGARQAQDRLDAAELAKRPIKTHDQILAEQAAREASRQPQKLAAPPEPEGFYVLDEYGESASDIFTDRLTWARAYANQSLGLTGDLAQAFEEFNAAGLSWAGEDERATEMLRDLARPEPQNLSQAPGNPAAPDDWENELIRERKAVALPMTRGGQINCAAYLTAIENDVESVCDVPTMRAWEEANAAIYLGDGFPIGTRTRILRLVMARKRVLGMQPANG